jgi:putative spermidine/putrescine transport system substrate-binding protein
MPVSMRRRRVLQGLAASATIGVAQAPWIGSRAAETLVVHAYGGEFQEVFVKTTVEPFEKKFGVKVMYDQSGMSSETYAKIRASRGNPGFDVAAELSEPEVLLGAKEGLLEKITEQQVPNIKYLWPRSLKILPYSTVSYYQYLALVWNRDKIDKPESWLDYWAPSKKYGDKIKGYVINYNPSNLLSIYALVMAARVSGGGVDNMEPAFALLKQQKPFVGTVVTSSAQAAPYFENGQVWISPFYSARAGWYSEHGYPIDMTVPKEGTIASGGGSSIPIGAANKKLAFEFLNFRLDPEIQRAFSLGYHCSPGRPDIGDWPKEYVEKQITTAEQMERMTFVDSSVISQKRREWTLTWQEIMGA